MAVEWRKNETAFLHSVIDSQLAAVLSFSPRSHTQRGDNKRPKHIYLTVRLFIGIIVRLYIPGLRPQQAFICFGQIPSHAAGAWKRCQVYIYVCGVSFYLAHVWECCSLQAAQTICSNSFARSADKKSFMWILTLDWLHHVLLRKGKLNADKQIFGSFTRGANVWAGWIFC